MNIRPLCLLLFSFMAASAQAEVVFVTLEKDNALALVDPLDGKLIKTVAIGQRPRGIVISPDNKVLYIAVSDDNTVKGCRISKAYCAITDDYMDIFIT